MTHLQLKDPKKKYYLSEIRNKCLLTLMISRAVFASETIFIYRNILLPIVGTS